MIKKACIRILMGLALCVVTVAVAGAQPLATVQEGSGGLQWSPGVSHFGLVLTVSGPESFYLRQEFAAGENPIFSVFDEVGGFRPAGTYVWELRPVVVLDPGVAAELATARDGGGEDLLAKASGLPREQRYASGSFSIVNGEVVAGGIEEPRGVAAGGENRLSPKVVLTNANGVIRNALCVGFDCPDAPAFGDSSVLMMENNNRIKFGDTSVSPFPLNDWEIEANSNLSGGASYLAFNDCGPNDNDGGCTTDLVFGVEAGARQRALWVESDGDVGLGTANPVLDLHIITGNTPGLRLEQDTSSGFAAQAWDIAGNETSFFVRDVTSGSTLPFRIRPGASSSSLVIDVDGDVGIGVLSPAAALEIQRGGGGAAASMVRLTNTNGPSRIEFRDNTGAIDWDFRTTSGDTFVITQPTSPSNDFQIASNGNVTVRGTLTTNGPTCGTGCDAVFDPDYALPSIAEHAAEMFANRYLPEVGPTTPKMPMNLSEKTGGILNELEKAHIYIVQLDAEKNRIERELREEIEALRATVEALLEEE